MLLITYSINIVDTLFDYFAIFFCFISIEIFCLFCRAISQVALSYYTFILLSLLILASS